MEKTLKELAKKYNLGVELDSEGRFYTGNNYSKIHEEAKQSKLSTISFLAKKAKEIVKKEFGITISASGKYYGYVGKINIVIKAPKNELFKSYEEIAENWISDDYQLICRTLHHHSNHGSGFNSSTKEVQKLYFEKYIQNRGSCAIGLSNKFQLIIEFLKSLLKSWNYDHTGACMGDCDYCDADFFSDIKIEPTDRDENLLYDLDHKIYNSNTIEELEKVLIAA